MTIEKSKKSHKGAQRAKGRIRRTKAPPPTSPENPPKIETTRPLRAALVALGGVSVCLSGVLWLCSCAALCARLRGVRAVGGISYTPEQIKTPCGAFFGLLRGEGKRKAPEGLRLVRGFGLIATNGGGASDLPTTAHGRQARRGLCMVCGSIPGRGFPGLGSSRSRTGAGFPLLWC